MGKKKETPGSEDRNNYLMLGRPKMAYYIEEDQANDEELNVEE